MHKFLIRGVVQGVGFRPFIYRKAKEAGRRGYVKNIGEGVEVVVDDATFIEGIQDWPPLARIDSVSMERIAYDCHDFSIESSDGEGAELPADIFMCESCRADLRDPNNRRYGYYFVTCTDCGPRFSMIEGTPYDRPMTSMAEFAMCEACRREYENPLDRRYHAQTIACPACGPKLKLLYNSVVLCEDDAAALKHAASLIKNGSIVAIKGVGGFHLCCLPDDDVVLQLRHMLGRRDKPFALMVRDEAMLATVACYTKKELGVLESPARPIVLVGKKKQYPLVSELDTLGVMFPYTSLHHLLFDYLDTPLVMTSANLPGEPVAVTEECGDYFL
ncbi:MAG: Sua5/YciO/YrdC/YwlC family protein, partial [Nanobdellota archaeon]